jgi:hypothetical protein
MSDCHEKNDRLCYVELPHQKGQYLTILTIYSIVIKYVCNWYILSLYVIFDLNTVCFYSQGMAIMTVQRYLLHAISAPYSFYGERFTQLQKNTGKAMCTWWSYQHASCHRANNLQSNCGNLFMRLKYSVMLVKALKRVIQCLIQY